MTSPLFLQNTLSRTREELVPRQPGTVSLYVCGVTPYDALHIGHARAFMAYDILRRVLESRGLSVQHIQNVTDVEDKIINRAKESGEEPLVLARRFSDEALEDTRALNILPAHQYPRVSDNIIPILDLIRGLEDKGFAYAKGGDVYFDVSKDLDYGKLSGQKPEELESGARELVFPHHENEVAQSESYLGEGATFAKVWWHCGELRVEGRKMSKSLGNFLTVRDALKLADANVWRLLFLMTHPRSPLDYSPKKLQEAQSAWSRLENALLEHESANIEYSNGAQSDATRAFQAQFDAALSDDLNTPEAIAAVFDAVGEWNRTHDQEVAQAARRALEVLGFTFQEKEIGDALTPKLLEVLIKVRNEARERRDWKTGDNVRDELKTLGVVLEDTPDGTKWKIERGATV